jgi:F-type H+-transporting ATPase subunit b
MVEERRAYIDESLVFAQKAHQEMLNLKAEGEVIVENARREHTKILHEANKMREAMIKDAKKKAQIEGEKILTDAKNQILIEKEDAIRAIRRQVAELSLDIAERVVRKKLDGEEEQMNMINRLLDEINISKS